MNASFFAITLGAAFFILLLIFVIYSLKTQKKLKELSLLENKFIVANQRIEEIDNERKEFIDIIMHELNTPLAITSGYLSMILELAKEDLKPKIFELVQKSYKSTQHMTEITNQLLSSSSSQITDSRPQGIQLEDLVQKTVASFDGVAKEKGIALIIKPPKQIPLPLVLADPLSVRKVISNLIDNSIKFTKQGEITVSTDVKEGEVVVSVTDTGVGIPKDSQARIFEQFFQADSSHTREVGGTGIGLYNTKTMIEEQGGKIWFESEEGKGTTFYFTLPFV